MIKTEPPSTADWKISNPDIVVYLPKDKHDTDNEHFLVTKAPYNDDLIAFWTQSSCECFGNNHIVMARSQDGIKWTLPMFLVGAKTNTPDQLQASWGFPVISAKGRIYLFYLRETGIADIDRATTGNMGCIYSDDNGCTWEQSTDIPMPRNKFDHSNPDVPKNWIVWQIPVRDSLNRLIAGYTQWTSKESAPSQPAGWYSQDSRCQFMRFENIDENPEPKDIVISWFPLDSFGLTVSYPGRPDVSVAQEPSIALLPDGRLFTTMRTFTGYIWYSVSDDHGQTWRKPEVLRYNDEGSPIPQPIAPCPIYAMRDGRYLLLFHNNDGNLNEYKPHHALYNRRPAFIAIGEFKKSAHQPIWFSNPKQLFDTNGITIGPKGTTEIATYTSFTEHNGKRILWYPDRKYFLLGKYITDNFLADMRVQ